MQNDKNLSIFFKTFVVLVGAYFTSFFCDFKNSWSRKEFNIRLENVRISIIIEKINK